MAQTAITVRIDKQQKAQFDKLCEQFGMSANTAINIFVKAVIRSKSIPFSIQAKNEEEDEVLTLTMRHPSWIFLFFGGRIVTFAPV